VGSVPTGRPADAEARTAAAAYDEAFELALVDAAAFDGDSAAAALGGGAVAAAPRDSQNAMRDSIEGARCVAPLRARAMGRGGRGGGSSAGRKGGDARETRRDAI
jgi:hypothetical protein